MNGHEVKNADIRFLLSVVRCQCQLPVLALSESLMRLIRAAPSVHEYARVARQAVCSLISSCQPSAVCRCDRLSTD